MYFPWGGIAKKNKNHTNGKYFPLLAIVWKEMKTVENHLNKFSRGDDRKAGENTSFYFLLKHFGSTFEHSLRQISKTSYHTHIHSHLPILPQQEKFKWNCWFATKDNVNVCNVANYTVQYVPRGTIYLFSFRIILRKLFYNKLVPNCFAEIYIFHKFTVAQIVKILIRLSNWTKNTEKNKSAVG